MNSCVHKIGYKDSFLPNSPKCSKAILTAEISGTKQPAILLNNFIFKWETDDPTSDSQKFRELKTQQQFDSKFICVLNMLA